MSTQAGVRFGSAPYLISNSTTPLTARTDLRSAVKAQVAPAGGLVGFPFSTVLSTAHSPTSAGPSVFGGFLAWGAPTARASPSKRWVTGLLLLDPLEGDQDDLGSLWGLEGRRAVPVPVDDAEGEEVFLDLE